MSQLDLPEYITVHYTEKENAFKCQLYLKAMSQMVGHIMVVELNTVKLL